VHLQARRAERSRLGFDEGAGARYGGGMHFRRIIFSLAVLAAAALASDRAVAATPNEIARFLAGLPMHGTSLEAIAARPQWVRHAMDFDDAWRELDKRSLTRIRTWAPEYLAPQYAEHGNVFYFFSGPDLLYAQALWPNARNYGLVAREPVGTLPEIEKVAATQLEPALANLHKTLNAALSWSFFITQDMKVDLNYSQLNGTLPILLLFAARAGCHIDAVELIGLDRDGALVKEGKAATRGVKIAVSGGPGGQQNIYYFEADLGDDVLRKNSAVLKFSEALGRGSSLLKAASYLMHEGGFEVVRNWLLTHSELLVEDDSGIPLRYFDRSKWVLRFCGHYPGPIPIFAKFFQPDLAAVYAAATPLPMGFSFGYQWQPSRSGLLIARPK
jgi:hypothetical protein